MNNEALSQPGMQLPTEQIERLIGRQQLALLWNELENERLRGYIANLEGATNESKQREYGNPKEL